MAAVPTSETALRASPWRLFRNRNFARLWIGAVASALGTAVGTIVITWIVYDTTHSALVISLLGIVQFLPTVFFGVLAGALIDRLDRRRLMVSCDAARAVGFAGLALFVLWFGANTGVLVVVVFAVAVFSTLFRPATNAAIPRILAPGELVDGNGLLQGGTTIAQFIGSPVGGVVLLALGAAVGLAVNALTFAISGVMILLMVIPSRQGPAVPGAGTRGSLTSEVGEGLRYLRSQRPLLIITVCAMGANFFLSMWGGFTVVYAVVQLHQGATGFAILVAANTAGFAIGSILPGRIGSDRAPGWWLLPTWGIVGFFLVGLAWTSSLILAASFTAIAGALLSFGNTTWLSGVQRMVPDRFLGRYFATDEAGSFALIPAGVAVGGFLIFTFGIAWTYLIAGIGALLVNVPMVLSAEIRGWGKEEAPP